MKTRLYKLERNKNIKIYGFKDVSDNDLVIIFGHIDGMYSYCWLENDPKAVIHLSASTPLETYEDGWKVTDEE